MSRKKTGSDTARQLRPDLPWKVQRIDPIPTTEYPTPARRPLNSRLDCTRLQRDWQIQLPQWQDALQQCLAEQGQ